jgi:hypothetical protein
VYSLNPTMTEMLTNQRVDEIGRQAAQCRLARLSRGRAPSRERLGSARKATGWALVEIGLRLAVPRRRPTEGGSAVLDQSGATRKTDFQVAR